MLSPSQIQPGILPALPARRFRDQSCTSRKEVLQIRTDRRGKNDEKCSVTSEGNHFTQSHTRTSLPAPASPGYHKPQEKHHGLNFKLHLTSILGNTQTQGQLFTKLMHTGGEASNLMNMHHHKIG